MIQEQQQAHQPHLLVLQAVVLVQRVPAGTRPAFQMVSSAHPDLGTVLILHYND